MIIASPRHLSRLITLGVVLYPLLSFSTSAQQPVPCSIGPRNVIERHMNGAEGTGSEKNHPGNTLVTIGEADFGSTMSGTEEERVITITNNSPRTMTVVEMEVVGSGPRFSLPNDWKKLLGTLPPGESRDIPVKFSPLGAGAHTANFHVRLAADGKDIVLNAPLKGDCYEFSCALNVPQEFAVAGGKKVMIPLQVDRQVDEVKLTRLYISLRYDSRTLALAPFGDGSDLVRGTLFEGSRIAITMNEPGQLVLELNLPAGRAISGKGTIMNFPFIGIDGADTASRICLLAMIGRFGTAWGFDSCYMVRRSRAELATVARTDAGAIESITPNPTADQVAIRFSLAKPGTASLDIYTTDGRHVAELRSGLLQEGEHHASWDVSQQPVGTYYCRLVAGGESMSMPVMVWR